MTAVELFDPSQGPAGGWPTASRHARDLLEGFAGADSRLMIANLRTRLIGVRWGDLVLPATVNAAEYGDSYVCLPHSAYALYAKAELSLVEVGPWAPILARLADVAGALLRAAAVNRIVHLDNWMLSTNLHGDWSGQGLNAMRTALARAFPRCILAVRSVDCWSNPILAHALSADGWRLLPSRRIWVVDDLARDWAPRSDIRRDQRLLAASPLQVDELEQLRPGDAERIADLYAMLYLHRYSTLNPAFTSAYIAMTHRRRLLVYRGLRDREGRLMAVVGCLIRGGVLTTPIVGYDTARPVGEGLYRMASVLFAEMALSRGLRLNGSAGAGGFKRNRGARGVTEHTAMFVDHLPPPRRAAIAALQAALNHVVLPMMVERGL